MFRMDTSGKWIVGHFNYFSPAHLYFLLHVYDKTNRLGAVAHTCNSSTLWGPSQVDCMRSGVQNQPGQHGEIPSLLKIPKKKEKKSWAWLKAPVIPATQEVETGESLDLGGRGCSEP